MTTALGIRGFSTTHTFSGSESEATITIPQNADSLIITYRLLMDPSASGSFVWGMQFNGDTGTNYNGLDNYHDASGNVVNGTGGGAGIAYLPFALVNDDRGAETTTSGEAYIGMYRRTTFYKNLDSECLYRTANSNAGTRHGQLGGEWENTSAITSIRFYNTTSATNLTAESYITVTGLRAATLGSGAAIL